jgi:hypothetical protein
VNLQPRLHHKRGIRIVGAAALASLAWAATASAQTPLNKHAAAIADFNKRIAAYVVFAKTLTDGLPPLKRTDDPVEIAAREVAMGSAIRAGRTGARPGDILTPEVAKVFRRLIKTDFRSRPREGQKVMLDEIPHFHPKVNQTYPSIWPLATFPPTLLAVMPPLPDGLEYRLLSEALILRDVRANIIVDFVLDVF